MLLASVAHARMAEHEKVAARRSVLSTSRGHAFESLAQWALSATTVANLYSTSIMFMAATGLAWTLPAPALHEVSLGTPLGRFVSVGPLAKLTYAIKRYILTHPRLH